MTAKYGVTALLLFATTLAAGPVRQAAAGWTVIGWNDLGMHCMDGDYTVFAILPPYNTIHAHLIDSSGRLVRSGSGVTVTYEAIRDRDGSINTTSTWKTRFWRYLPALFGATLDPDLGLTGNAMPGPGNQPRAMKFETTGNTFIADGIPLTNWDDDGNKNMYPMMRLTARNSAGAVLATTDIVLPVSDEMDCRACHQSGARAQTQPQAGWVSQGLTERDYKLNILRLHDEHRAPNAAYGSALRALGYKADGLYATVMAGTPILCGSCHATNALGTKGQASVPPLTSAIHTLHAGVIDPLTGLTLDSDQNRSACYRCHPGSETRCLRGAMGAAVAADGSMAMHCQSCHGSMSDVGAQREGWLDEPGCQSCHTGTATRNSGQIRYTSVFSSPGVRRQPADTRFATTANVPAAGFSLYRFSSGHGGLQCEACHGSTHAEFPSSHYNDNVQSTQLQGHAGTLGECGACHVSIATGSNGPHGMHVVGDAWVRGHQAPAESNPAPCQDCHGADYSGTVLSRAFNARTLATEFGTKQLWRGYQISCYLCHNGPRSESRSSNQPPTASAGALSVDSGGAGDLTLSATDPEGNALTRRIVSQPLNGTVALAGSQATYRAFAGFEGTDSFTWAAWDGKVNSNLATVSVTVRAATRPQITAGGVVNAASYQGGGVAPGEMITIFGAGMGPAQNAGLALNSAGLVARSLAGTRVLFDNLPAPLVYSMEGQLAAIVPFGVAGRASTPVQVEYQGIRSAPEVVNVTDAVPGIFSRDMSGAGLGAFVNVDSGALNSPANPAARGSIVSAYATGQGAFTAAMIDGELPGYTPLSASLPVTVTVGGIDARVLFAGAAPLNAGLLQVNFEVPQGVAPGSAVAVLLKIGDKTSRAGITMAVR